MKFYISKSFGWMRKPVNYNPSSGRDIHETTMSDEEKPIKYDYFSINKNVEIIFSYNFNPDLNNKDNYILIIGYNEILILPLT